MTITPDTLRALPYFADLPEDLLERVCEESEELSLETDTVIIEEGSDSEEMYVLVEGELVVTKLSGEKQVELARIRPGEVVGEIALLDRAPRTATVASAGPAIVIRVPAKAFEELLGDAGVVRRMIHTVTSRLRGIEDSLRHEERMGALGRMAAQLMHELNNPAAAVGRSTRELARVYDELGEEAITLTASLGEGAELSRPGPPPEMTPLERSEAEDLVADWLTKQGVEDPWELASPMIDVGWSPETLSGVVDQLSPELRSSLARWIGLRATAQQIIGELGIGAHRISELVRIVKDYSYLDQAPVQEVVPTDGIKDTMVLLKHKLSEIEVVTDFAPDLASVEAPGRDLNQVWTNLIDNGADAMDDGGTLTVTARNKDGWVVIEVADTGHGMPPDVAERIFDPFFTTKEPGKGTGLGLHTVHTIINRIGGEISVESGSEGTTFTVALPAVTG